MSWYKLHNKEEIKKIINYLVSSKTEIKVQIDGKKNIFVSKIIKIGQGNISSDNGKRPELIIAKLSPWEGNTLIQSVTEVSIESLILEHACQYSVKYMGTSNTHPYFGFFLSFPETVRIEERRKEERVVYEMPELFSVQFRLGNGGRKERVYDLNVHNGSGHGLGLLIPEKDFDLLEMVNVGDKLCGIIFFAREAIIRGNGTVRHKTKIGEGKYKGCYVMGIETGDIV